MTVKMTIKMTQFDDIEYNDRTKTLIEELEAITTVDSTDNTVVVDDFNTNVWEKHLPESLTVALVNELSEYRRDVGVAVCNAIGKRITQHALENDDVSIMDVRLDTPDVGYGFAYSRPTAEKPTKANIRNGMTSYCVVEHSSLGIETLDALTTMWQLDE